MKLYVPMIAVAATVALVGVARAAAPQGATSHDNQQLTQFGAIKAGNKAGTIPAYTGGLKVTDQAYKEKPYPYANEKPRLVISSKNMDKYSDELTQATKILLKRYPDYHLNIYPTHRSVSYPGWLLKKTVENGKNPNCKLISNDLGLSSACRGGLPFPHPENGNQVMWNHLLAYNGKARKVYNNGYYRAGGTAPVLATRNNVYYQSPYYQKDPAHPELYSEVRGIVLGPPRQQGLQQVQWYFLNPADNGHKLKKTWVYTPGLRRVRVSPNASHDTPLQGTGGAMTYAEQYLFSGMMDRFNFKLVGKKEMFLPYNSFKSVYGCSFVDTPTKGLKPHFVDPQCSRWELHRVWVVKATLKPGSHDVSAKRMYYFDEDGYESGMYEAWDHSDTLVRFGTLGSIPYAHCHCTLGTTETFYNLNKRNYVYIRFAPKKYSEKSNRENVLSKPLSESLFNARNVGGSGIF